MADDNAQPDVADAATQPAALPSAPMLAEGSNADGTQEGDPGDWNPPQTDAQGFALDGHGYPLNLRLRALRLADAGETEDPANSVSPDAIAAAADQLDAYDSEFKPLDGMDKAALAKQADREGVTVPDGALKDDIRAAIETARPVRI